jgi:peptidoglycan/LPS O-acetylase OafA/YrhL
MSYATRIPCLDGLRGLAALAVVLFHFNIFFLPQARLPFVGRAYLAVDLFFMLSGFVMAHVYGRLLASNWRVHAPLFARARFARLYPLFAVTTLGMLVVFALSHRPLSLVSFSGGSLALQPFLLQQWAPGLSWDYPSWSISTEAEAYVSFVFCSGLLLAGKHPRLIATGCIAVARRLPSYAHPLFLRITDALDSTETFKQKKHQLIREGFNPVVVTDPLHLRDPQGGAYVPLDRALYARITATSLRF